MNQQIQVIDGFEYDHGKSALKVQCIAFGALIDCYIVEVEFSASHQFYQNNQFDIEEKIINLVENEDFNTQGNVEIHASNL